MVVIKTEMQELPKYCEGCSWYGSHPHPYKGWTDMCELMGHCMDDDQPEEWMYDGNGRPAACPLIEVSDWIPVDDMLPVVSETIKTTK